MKILFCNYEYPPLGGGGGGVNAMLAEYLSKGHDVTVLTSSGPGLAQDEMVNGVRVIRVPVYVRKQQAAANFPSMAAYMINGVRRGKALLSDGSFDIINTHFALPSGPVGHALSRFSGLPNVLSVHGGDLYDPSKFTSPHRHWILRAWIKRLLREADSLVGQSNNTISNVKRFYDDRLNVHCIPLGIHRPQFSVVSRSQLGLNEDDFVLVTVGRLVSRKGLDRLLRILSRASIDNLKLVVVGSGPREGELMTLAKDVGLSESVVFKGFVSEEYKFQILQVADLYVSSSQHEGFGLVFLEAMSTSIPIICYNHGGQSDFLEDGVTGALLELNDEEGFLKAVNSLYANREKRKEIGDYNHRKVESFYIDSCAASYEALFEDVVSQKHVVISRV